MFGIIYGVVVVDKVGNIFISVKVGIFVFLFVGFLIYFYLGGDYV